MKESLPYLQQGIIDKFDNKIYATSMVSMIEPYRRANSDLLMRSGYDYPTIIPKSTDNFL